MLQAEAEAQPAFARLEDTRAECNEQHKAMTAELEAMQSSVKENLRATNQQHTVQSAKVDAMGYRLEAMKDIFLQRELRMEVQTGELNTKMHTLSTAPMAATNSEQMNMQRPVVRWCLRATPDPRLILKANSKTVTKAPKPPEATKWPSKVHMCAPNKLSTVQLPSTLSLTRTQDRGLDHLTNTLSVIDLTDTKATAGSQTSSVEDDAYAIARVKTTGADSVFLTASEGVHTGNPCASSTRKKEPLNEDLSVQATKGSRDNSPAASSVTKKSNLPRRAAIQRCYIQSHVQGTGSIASWLCPLSSPA